MYRGFLTSFIGHALLLGWALISIHRTPELMPEIVAIEATLITPSELTRLKQGDPESKIAEAKAKEEEKPDLSKKEAEKPKPVTEPPPAAAPPPEPPKAEEPKPEPPKAEEPKKDAIADKLAALPPPPEPLPTPGPTPEDKQKLEEKLEQEKKAEEKKKAEDKKKSEEKKKKLAEAKKKFDADKIAALIDKSPDKRGAPRSAVQPTKPTDYTGPTTGEREGHDTVLSAREQDLLKSMINSQLQPCAKMPGGGGGTDTPVVNVRFQLRQDGSLDGEPVLVAPQSSPLYSIAADASIRAIKQCAPFQLPADKYGAWSTVTWEFDWPVILGLVQR